MKMPVQDDSEGYSHIGGQVPTNHKTALEDLAYHRSERRDRVSVSQLLRDAIELYLETEAEKEDLPGEILDLLDDDLVANAGGTK